MNTQTDIKVLHSLLALHLEVNIWTARKKLSPEDFAGAVLPSDDLASLGSKRICDPESLSIFGTLKSRAVSLPDRHGVRFLGGWDIPENQADDIVTELRQIQDDFNVARDAFLDSTGGDAQKWWRGWHESCFRMAENHTCCRKGFRLVFIISKLRQSSKHGSVSMGSVRFFV